MNWYKQESKSLKDGTTHKKKETDKHENDPNICRSPGIQTRNYISRNSTRSQTSLIQAHPRNKNQ